MTPMIGTTAAAERVGVSKSTFQRMVVAGRITPVHRGEQWRGAMVFDLADVEALADEEKTRRDDSTEAGAPA